MFDFAAKCTLQFCAFVMAALPLFFCSCRSIKNAPQNKPFVYKTNINLHDNRDIPNPKQLTGELENQLHDSVKVRSVQKILLTEIVNPPVFDSANADKSIDYMSSYLNSIGYYRDSINYSVSIQTKNQLQQATIDFNLLSAQLFKIDSIRYNLLIDTSETEQKSPSRDTLQRLTNRSLKESFIKKGDPFSTSVLVQEINRLSDIYRNNGFLRFSSEEMLVLWDTVGLALIRPTLDPFEQAQQLEQLREHKLHPTASIEFRLRTSSDSSRLVQYHIGNVRVYPDMNADTAFYLPTTDTVDGYEFVSYPLLFRPQKLTEFIYLHKGDLYRQSNFIKTLNKFNSLAAWKLVNITPVPRAGQDTVDFDIKLIPAIKYHFSADLEGSHNQTPITLGGNLLGIGINLGIQNRNFVRAANTSTTNFRYGIELDASSDQPTIQSQQYAVSYGIQAPRKIPRGLPLFRKTENIKSVFGTSLAYTDRYEYYIVKSANTSFGYEFSQSNKLFNIRFPNIEYNFLQKERFLDSLIEKNTSYRYIFNDGLILSVTGNLTWVGGRKNVTNLKNFGIEISGVGPTNFIRSAFLDSNLYRFVKVDAEFRQTHKIRRSAFAWRGFMGIGWELPSNNNRNNKYLPFFRQYFTGGPNSMRAWGVRKLGPGSALKSFSSTEAPDRFGDIRLEANAEYRFYLTTITGIPLYSAVYVDVGNVWFLRKNPDFPDGEFRFNKLWRDIAIGTGTGLRVDFSFLKLRFDYAYKIKNPTPDINKSGEQNKWFYNWELLNGQFQLGIDYPF